MININNVRHHGLLYLLTKGAPFFLGGGPRVQSHPGTLGQSATDIDSELERIDIKLDIHYILLVSQLTPVQPAEQLHEYLFTSLMHRPLCWQG